MTMKDVFSVKSLLNPETPVKGSPPSLAPATANHPIVGYPTATRSILPQIGALLTRTTNRTPSTYAYITRHPEVITTHVTQSSTVPPPYIYPKSNAATPTPRPPMIPSYGQRISIMPTQGYYPAIRAHQPYIPTGPYTQQPPSAPISGGEIDSRGLATPYARSPRLKHLHKLAERKRRSHLRLVFDQLRDTLGESTGKAPVSKADIVDSAILTIDKMTERINELHRIKADLQ